MSKNVAFTGHRYMKTNQDWAHEALNAAVKRAADSGSRWFMSGGAIGWDLWFLEAAMVERWRQAGKPSTTFESMFDVKGLPDGVVVQAALPFKGFWNYYKEKDDSDRIYLNNLYGQLDLVAYVSEGGYSLQKIHKRNRWVIDENDIVITMYDGRDSGGTYQTLKYAKKKKRPILWINPVNKTERWIRYGVDYE